MAIHFLDFAPFVECDMPSFGYLQGHILSNFPRLSTSWHQLLAHCCSCLLSIHSRSEIMLLVYSVRSTHIYLGILRGRAKFCASAIPLMTVNATKWRKLNHWIPTTSCVPRVLAHSTNWNLRELLVCACVCACALSAAPCRKNRYVASMTARTHRPSLAFPTQSSTYRSTLSVYDFDPRFFRGCVTGPRPSFPFRFALSRRH